MFINTVLLNEELKIKPNNQSFSVVGKVLHFLMQVKAQIVEQHTYVVKVSD